MDYHFEYTEDSIWVSKQMEEYGWIQDKFKKNPGARLPIFRVFDVLEEDVVIVSEGLSTTVNVRIGSFENGIYKISGDVLSSDYSLYIRPNFKITDIRWFKSSYGSKVMKTILETIGSDVTVGDEEGDLSLSVLQSVISQFPTKTEIKHYIETRISKIVSEDLQLVKDHEAAFQTYMDKRRKVLIREFKDIDEYDLEKFSFLEEQMVYMLNHQDEYDETDWQIRIMDIVCIIFPQYILASREKTLTEVFGHNKRVDFLLVDSSGYIDVMEIKKPDVPLLRKNPDPHNNIVPTIRFSNCVMQVETYLHSLTISNNDKLSKITEKLRQESGTDIRLSVLNPRGLIIMGYFEDELSDHQTLALEILRRQYSHIADIITYNDLLTRIHNIIVGIKTKLKKHQSEVNPISES